MTTTEMWITILIVGFATMLTRFLPFVLFPAGKQVPAFVSYLGRVLPYAAMGLLVIYCLKGVPYGSFADGAFQLIAALVVIVVHLLKRNTLLSIAAGTAAYMILIRL